MQSQVHSNRGGHMLDAVQHTAVKPASSTALAQFVKGFAFAVAVILGVSAAPRPAAAETPAEFISIIGADVLQEMRSTAPIDQKET